MAPGPHPHTPSPRGRPLPQLSRHSPATTSAVPNSCVPLQWECPSRRHGSGPFPTAPGWLILHKALITNTLPKEREEVSAPRPRRRAVTRPGPALPPLPVPSEGVCLPPPKQTVWKLGGCFGKSPLVAYKKCFLCQVSDILFLPKVAGDGWQGDPRNI